MSEDRRDAIEIVSEIVKVAARAAIERLAEKDPAAAGLSLAFVIHDGRQETAACIGGVNTEGGPEEAVRLLIRGAAALSADCGRPFVVLPAMGSSS